MAIQAPCRNDMPPLPVWGLPVQLFQHTPVLRGFEDQWVGAAPASWEPTGSGLGWLSLEECLREGGPAG